MEDNWRDKDEQSEYEYETEIKQCGGDMPYQHGWRIRQE